MQKKRLKRQRQNNNKGYICIIRVEMNQIKAKKENVEYILILPEFLEN